MKQIFVLSLLVTSCSVGIPTTDTTMPVKHELDCSKISDTKDSDDVVKDCFDVEVCCDREDRKLSLIGMGFEELSKQSKNQKIINRKKHYD